MRNRLAIAVSQRTYKAYRALLSSPRWQRIYNAGARPERLLWASTGTTDPKVPDIMYIRALAATFTVNTIPEAMLKSVEITATSRRSCDPTAETVRRR